MAERLPGEDGMPGGVQDAWQGERISDQGEGVSSTFDKAV